MNGLLLVVTIGGCRAAIRAAEVQSVVELDAMAPVPRAPVFVAGLAALRSRALTVIDCARSLECTGPVAPKGPPTVAVVERDGHLYGLLVDAVDDVVEAGGGLAELRTAPQGGWKRAALGVAETAMGPLPVLDTAVLVAGPPARDAA